MILGPFLETQCQYFASLSDFLGFSVYSISLVQSYFKDPAFTGHCAFSAASRGGKLREVLHAILQRAMECGFSRMRTRHCIVVMMFQ